MRHKILTSTTMAAMLFSGPFPSPMPTASARSIAPQGFCRTPAPLPQLGAETSRRQDVQIPREEARDRLGHIKSAPSAVAAPPPPPPAPPPASMADRVDESESVVATGSRDGGASDRAMSVAPEGKIMPRRPYPQPQPLSGILTAGEHDDLLNPELYAAYIHRSDLGQVIPDLPRVDTTRMVTVKVNDSSGQPVPFADVTVTCSDGNRITLATQTDGTAVFFPGLDRLSERVSVSASRAGLTLAAARPVLVSNAPGGQLIGLTANRSAAKATKLDLMLVIDTTGSMGDEIRYLQSELRSILASVSAKHRNLDIRVGFVFYRDLGDDYITRTVAFDSNISRAQGVLAQQSANGGGDYPEAMDQAMIRAVGQDWRPDAVKSLLLVADAPPHDNQFGRTWAAAEAARAKRIQITPIAASGVADKAEYAMRAMAAATQSRYLFLTDDSGVGNSHAAPAIDCYLVTRLDALVRRVIDSQISGRRIEPDDREVIRSVGHYDAGKCILPADFNWRQ